MKKIMALVLTAIITVTMCSCGDEKKMIIKEDIIEMEVDARQSIHVLNVPADKVKWESADGSVAVVSSDGIVSAIGRGITTVKASYKDQYAYVGVIVESGELQTDKNGNVVYEFNGQSDITEITVGVVGGGKEDITVKKGEKFKLKAYTVPSNSTDKIFWQTENSSIVKVDENGQIQIVGTGKTAVNAYAPNGVKGSIILRCK